VVIAIDFDGTIVEQGHAYDDVTSPLVLMPGAKEALLALKKAEHLLILWSARASRWLLYNPSYDPLVRVGKRRMNVAQWEKARPLNVARYQQMLAFVAKELPGVFDAIDDGAAGKVSADLFIDDRAIKYGEGLSGLSWANIKRAYGSP
jgi:hypothetical protein